ncbi:MAG: hypothetical protein QGH40_06170 [bacterium]|nr:hypothetical protein [bacterium]
MATKGSYRASQSASAQPRAATVVDLALTPTGSVRGRVLLSGQVILPSEICPGHLFLSKAPVSWLLPTDRVTLPWLRYR